MIKIKNEKLFVFFSHQKLKPTEKGREQFFKEQSIGVSPENIDSYYLLLTKGKENFDFLCREYQQMYIKGEWWGFLQLWEDWKGNRWILKSLCKWHKKVPEWLNNEKITIEEICKKERLL